LGTLGTYAKIKACVIKLAKYSLIPFKEIQSRMMDRDYDEECQEISDDALQDATAANRDGLCLGFGSSKPGCKDKEGNPIITIVDRSGVHEIGVSWCCCPEAPERDMQLMMAGLFPATFRNPKTAFTFKVLEDFHLDNLECKTTASQFFSRLRRLTNDEFPNTVPVRASRLI
jgi:CxC2 like cysteine cluster associated with KDZ transposases